MKKVCEVCGKEYETLQPYQKTCSPECRKKKDAAYQKLYREVYHDELLEKAKDYRNLPKVKKICEVCGKEFVTTYRNKKTCSPECQKKRKDAYYKMYHKVHHDEFSPKNIAHCYMSNWQHEESLTWNFEKVFEAYDEGKINYQQLCELEAYRVEKLGYLGGC